MGGLKAVAKLNFTPASMGGLLSLHAVKANLLLGTWLTPIGEQAVSVVECKVKSTSFKKNETWLFLKFCFTRKITFTVEKVAKWLRCKPHPVQDNIRQDTTVP